MFQAMQKTQIHLPGVSAVGISVCTFDWYIHMRCQTDISALTD